MSLTDPDSGYMVRDEKPEGFFYLDHRTVDGKYNFITDVYVTPERIGVILEGFQGLNKITTGELASFSLIIPAESAFHAVVSCSPSRADQAEFLSPFGVEAR